MQRVFSALALADIDAQYTDASNSAVDQVGNVLNLCVSRRAPRRIRHLSFKYLLVALQCSIDIHLAERVERAEEVPRVLADDGLRRHTEPALVGAIGELAALGGVTVR